MKRIFKSRAAKWTAGIAAAVLGIAVVCGAYLGDYYRADEEAIAAFVSDNAVKMQRMENGDVIWEPEAAHTGLIFYPGGKVEHMAYAPLMSELAERGVLCVLTEMPFRLAVLDVNAAQGVQEAYPQVENWYMGGHSLGGSMAAAYAAEHAEAFDGLILLGAYSTAELQETGLRVLSIYGSRDGVMNRETYEESRANLPEAFTECVLEGGCHAGFGMYGAQEGDGSPLMSNEEQIIQTAEEIARFME